MASRLTTGNTTSFVLACHVCPPWSIHARSALSFAFLLSSILTSFDTLRPNRYDRIVLYRNSTDHRSAGRSRGSSSCRVRQIKSNSTTRLTLLLFSAGNSFCYSSTTWKYSSGEEAPACVAPYADYSVNRARRTGIRRLSLCGYRKPTLL